MVVKWLGKDFALDILAVFPLYGHFDCLFCRIMHRQVKKKYHGIILKQCRDNLFFTRLQLLSFIIRLQAISY